MTRWLVRAAVLLGAVAGAGAAVVGASLYPYLRDDVLLDRIVREVALDWRDFGEAEARERLAYEFDHRRIGAWVADDDCQLRSEEGGRRVACAWEVVVRVPFADAPLTLSFASDAEVPEPRGP